MLTREQVEAIVHNPMNADWGHVLQLADDWLDMHDAIDELVNRLVEAMESSREKYGEVAACVRLRIDDLLKAAVVAIRLRARLAALEDSTRRGEK